MQKNWLYNVLFAQRKISNWITSENNKKGIFFHAYEYMHIYACWYIFSWEYDTFAVAVTQNVPMVPPFTIREGNFTDYIA